MAGLQIRAYVNGKQEYIELYDSENITMSVSFAEIQDITKKNSAFTKEFKVPGSKNNNYIFNYFYDINTVALDWNPKKKFEADLLYDGYELYNGYVRLNSVTIDKTEKIYSVTFYSAMGDLAANIGDKALCNVDTTSLNHNVYETVIAENFLSDASLQPWEFYAAGTGWDEFINPVTKGDVKYILGQRGYDYTGTTYASILDIDTQQTPILEFSGINGFFDYYKSPLIASYFIPSIRGRKLYELIVNQAGYQIESEFFNSDYFGRYYLPLSFNTDQPFMNQAVINKFIWNNENPVATQSSAYTITAYGTFIPYPNQRMILPQVVLEDNAGFNPVNPTNYPFFDFNSISAFSAYTFAIPYNNGQQYAVNVEIDVEYTGSSTSGSIIAGGSYYVWEFVSNTSSLFARLAGSGPIVYTETPGSVTTTSIFFNSSNLTNQNGGSFMFVTYDDPTYAGTDTVLKRMYFKTDGTSRILPLKIELYKEMACDQKQVEFIQNINRMFNLVVVEHPIKPKTLIIEPIVNYIGKGAVLDWTGKVDYNSPQNLYPTTALINGSIFAANKVDKDFVNTEYQKKSNLIFGQKIIDLNIDYKNETTKLVQTLGQNTDYYLDTPGDAVEIALPCYFISKENNKNGISNYEYRPFRSLPRLVFASVPIPTGNTQTNPIFYRYGGTNNPFTSVGLISKGTIQNVNRLTTYPFAISGFSHYTTYDPSNVFTQDELVYPELESQYDRYYKDYIDDLIAEDNKIYTCKMYLNPWEVAQLRFDEVIIIKNAKFRINKITNLSLNQSQLTDVELVKLTKDYTPTPRLYYDLIDCDDPCNIIHSHTDLNYLLWAFEGYYVELITSFGVLPAQTSGRFKVVKSSYNPEFTYENVFFESYQSFVNPAVGILYGVTWDYALFNDCDTLPSGATQTLNVINDFDPEYVSPTSCYEYTVTNTGSTSSTFAYIDCNGNSGNYTLSPSGSVSFCATYGSLQGIGFEYCISFAECGLPPLPTPTPTPTAIPITPTATSTPTPTPTETSTPTPTATSTPTPTPTETSTPTPTPTQTSTPTPTQTSTPTPTPTQTATSTPTPTQTSTPTPTPTSIPSSYLLDNYPSASIAYSTRKLRSGYTGNVLRVRRSSDNAELDIPFNGDSIDVSVLTTFVGANDGRVTIWYDQSGGGFNLTQTTAVKQPFIVEAGTVVTYGGEVCVRTLFTGSAPTSIGMQQTNDITNPFCLASAFLEEDSNSGRRALSANNQNALISSRRTNNNTIYTEATIYNPTWGSNNVMQVTFFNKVSTTSLVYTNTTLLLNGTTSANKLGTIGIGSAVVYTPSEGANAKFGELVVWEIDQTSNRAAIINDIQTYWV